MTGHGRQAADTAADAGFECPECHQTARFTADGVLLSGRVGIGPDGWDWTEGGSYDAELPPGTMLACGECGYAAQAVMFAADHDDRTAGLPSPRGRFDATVGDDVTVTDAAGSTRTVRIGSTVVLDESDGARFRFRVAAIASPSPLAGMMHSLIDESAVDHPIGQARWSTWPERPADDVIRLEHRHSTVTVDLPKVAVRPAGPDEEPGWHGPGDEYWPDYDWRAADPDPVRSDGVRDWYMAAYPDDDLGAGIDPSLTFDDALAAVPSGGGFYDVLGVGDSLVRERVFRELSDRGDIDYGTIYDSWITGTPVAGPMPDGVTGTPGMDGTLLSACSMVSCQYKMIPEKTR